MPADVLQVEKFARVIDVPKDVKDNSFVSCNTFIKPVNIKSII